MSQHDDDDEWEEFDVPENKSGRIPDTLKTVLSGLSGMFAADEGLRNLVSEKIPKDAMGYVAQQTEKTRREIFRIVSHEVKGFLRGTDVMKQVRQSLTGMKIQVRADIRFVEDKPEVKIKSRVQEHTPESASPAVVSEETKDPKKA